MAGGKSEIRVVYKNSCCTFTATKSSAKEVDFDAKSDNLMAKDNARSSTKVPARILKTNYEVKAGLTKNGVNVSTPGLIGIDISGGKVDLIDINTDL